MKRWVICLIFVAGILAGVLLTSTVRAQTDTAHLVAARVHLREALKELTAATAANERPTRMAERLEAEKLIDQAIAKINKSINMP